jgi:hypothetical protein
MFCDSGTRVSSDDSPAAVWQEGHNTNSNVSQVAIRGQFLRSG